MVTFRSNGFVITAIFEYFCMFLATKPDFYKGTVLLKESCIKEYGIGLLKIEFISNSINSKFYKIKCACINGVNIDSYSKYSFPINTNNFFCNSLFFFDCICLGYEDIMCIEFITTDETEIAFEHTAYKFINTMDIEAHPISIFQFYNSHPAIFNISGVFKEQAYYLMFWYKVFGGGMACLDIFLLVYNGADIQLNEYEMAVLNSAEYYIVFIYNNEVLCTEKIYAYQPLSIDFSNTMDYSQCNMPYY
jgi:hypothetical protein